MLYERQQYQSTDLERAATNARNRFEIAANVAGISGGVAAALGLVAALLYARPAGGQTDASAPGN
jgi:crotonobetainyl-CoA:carnitine CoA-transferase CaiB-like acyl-CoA transferase